MLYFLNIWMYNSDIAIYVEITQMVQCSISWKRVQEQDLGVIT